jgi:hypothetical protein
MNKICACGRPIPNRYNSTIQASLCPNCTYKANSKQKNQPVTKEKKARKPPVKWRDKPINEMIQHVQQYIVNPYIRERDNVNFNGRSISDRGPVSTAGHYFSVGGNHTMRFNIQNIHGQSISGNMHKSGDLLNYRKGLINRHGIEYVEELETMQHNKTRLDRLNVILIAETYLYLTKFKIWVYRNVEFMEYLQKLQPKL